MATITNDNKKEVTTSLMIQIQNFIFSGPECVLEFKALLQQGRELLKDVKNPSCCIFEQYIMSQKYIQQNIIMHKRRLAEKDISDQKDIINTLLERLDSYVEC